MCARARNAVQVPAAPNVGALERIRREDVSELLQISLRDNDNGQWTMDYGLWTMDYESSPAAAGGIANGGEAELRRRVTSWRPFDDGFCASSPLPWQRRAKRNAVCDCAAWVIPVSSVPLARVTPTG